MRIHCVAYLSPGTRERGEPLRTEAPPNDLTFGGVSPVSILFSFSRRIILYYFTFFGIVNSLFIIIIIIVIIIFCSIFLFPFIKFLIRDYFLSFSDLGGKLIEKQKIKKKK
jgi:hypothetical protein